MTEVAQSQQGWNAELDLRFARRADVTQLARRSHKGPLVVQRPFHPEADGTCHVYLLHPPGGIVGGDVLNLSAHAEVDSRVLLTTPAATKCYRTDGRLARQCQTLTVEAGARMEWLPQETIVFDGATCELRTRVQLAVGAHYLGWEITCLGRPACGERFTRGSLAASMEIWREQTPLWIERFAYTGGGAVAAEPWGLDDQPVMATLVCVTPEPGSLVEELRAALAHLDDCVVVSQLHDVLVCRYLGPSVEQARNAFVVGWTHLRRAMWGSEASPPRIWAT